MGCHWRHCDSGGVLDSKFRVLGKRSHARTVWDWNNGGIPRNGTGKSHGSTLADCDWRNVLYDLPVTRSTDLLVGPHHQARVSWLQSGTERRDSNDSAFAPNILGVFSVFPCYRETMHE